MENAVRIKPYDKNLPIYFRKEEKLLTKNIGKGFKINHIGSSAVPGLGGKNVVDIQLLASNKNVSKKLIKKLESIGYLHNKEGGDKYRIFFNKHVKYGQKKVHIHLHIMWKTATVYERHLIFRDYLREHPEEIDKYFLLKKKWAKEAGANRKKYSYLKTDYITGILKKAKSFYL